ncbi:MAG: hypothetical protein ABEK50_09875 [bacterium]
MIREIHDDEVTMEQEVESGQSDQTTGAIAPTQGFIRYVKWAGRGRREDTARSVPADRAICLQYRAGESN